MIILERRGFEAAAFAVVQFAHQRCSASSRPCDMNFSEATLADAVVSRMDCEDERFKSVMTSLIRSLHAFVREVEPTEEEWLKIVHFPAYRARRESHANRMAAIRFLTQTGQRSDDKRAEFILLSGIYTAFLWPQHAAAAIVFIMPP